MGLWAERACMGGVVGKHCREGVVRGVGAPVVVAVPGRDLRAGAVPVDGDEGGRHGGRPGPRVRGVVVAGGAAEEAEADGIVGRVVREGVPDSTARDATDGLVRVRWIGCHQRRRKEKGGLISTASAVLVPSFDQKAS